MSTTHAMHLVLNGSATSSNSTGEMLLQIFASAAVDSLSFTTAVSDSGYPFLRFQSQVECPFYSEWTATTFSPTFPGSLYLTVFFYGFATFVLYVCEDGDGFTRSVEGEDGGYLGVRIRYAGERHQVDVLLDSRRRLVMSHCLRGCGVAGGSH